MIIAASNEPLRDKQINLKTSQLFALDQTRAERGAAAISIFEHAM
jgi:hypothetical protein